MAPALKAWCGAGLFGYWRSVNRGACSGISASAGAAALDQTCGAGVSLLLDGLNGAISASVDRSKPRSGLWRGLGHPA
ncbi:MAG TPA: hypothetical protein DCG72_01995 [Gammaproteobacteria bacterium]|nr:hypothetical protein [Gammaproteobacteria bacterium]